MNGKKDNSKENSDKSTLGDFGQSNKLTCAIACVPFDWTLGILLRIELRLHISLPL